jgi:hypothetical protein
MATEEKQTKAAYNQSLFRDVNERVREVSAGLFTESETVEFLCECADTSCTQTIALTMAEYEAVRRAPTHFPVLPGHELPDVERTIERHDRYIVVEKQGEAGKIAVQTWRDEEKPSSE